MTKKFNYEKHGAEVVALVEKLLRKEKVYKKLCFDFWWEHIEEFEQIENEDRNPQQWQQIYYKARKKEAEKVEDECVHCVNGSSRIVSPDHLCVRHAEKQVNRLVEQPELPLEPRMDAVYVADESAMTNRLAEINAKLNRILSFIDSLPVWLKGVKG